MSNILITGNRIDKILLRDYVKELIMRSKSINTVDGHQDFLLECEEKLAEFFGVEDVLLVNSGTDAIHLCLLNLNIGKGDKVIIPATTYISVGLAVWYTGAEIVPIDISEEDMLIDVKKIERHITSKVKAIIMVHMFGQCCNIKNILKIGKKYNLKIIENACQAVGTKYNNERVGKFGDIGVVSFRYAKTISSFSGNGGAILLKRKGIKKNIRENYMDIFRGRRTLFNGGKKFHNISFFDALTVFIKMRKFREIERKKIQCQKVYESELKGIKEVKFFLDPPNVSSVRPFFLILAQDRDRLAKYLFRRGIFCELGYPPIVAFRRFGKFKLKDFPVALKHWKLGLRLPLFPFMEPEEAYIVCKEIKKFYE